MDKKLKCLVVDDELISREIVESYINDTPNLELTASCENAFEALDVLQHQPVDILFTDIQMPKVNGLELVKTLLHPPAIIFITGHRDFAVDGYELNITDYLMKPVSYERFLKSVNKAVSKIETDPKTAPAAASPDSNNEIFIFVRMGNEFTKLIINDIVYIEAADNFVKIHIGKETKLIYSTMTDMEKKLPAEKFFRIHKSYLVALRHIKNLVGNVLELTNGDELSIAKARKDELYKSLNIK